VLDISGLDRAISAAKADAEKAIAEKTRKVLLGLTWDLTQITLDHTPVWRGTAVANWNWSVDAPDARFTAAVAQPREGWRGTNAMLRGEEPRRPSNEALVHRSWEGLDFKDPFRVFYFSNAAPHAQDLELGNLPESPLVSRVRTQVGEPPSFKAVVTVKNRTYL